MLAPRDLAAKHICNELGTEAHAEDQRSSLDRSADIATLWAEEGMLRLLVDVHRPAHDDEHIRLGRMRVVQLVEGHDFEGVTACGRPVRYLDRPLERRVLHAYDVHGPASWLGSGPYSTTNAATSLPLSRNSQWPLTPVRRAPISKFSIPMPQPTLFEVLGVSGLANETMTRPPFSRNSHG